MHPDITLHPMQCLWQVTKAVKRGLGLAPEDESLVTSPSPLRKPYSREPGSAAPFPKPHRKYLRYATGEKYLSFRPPLPPEPPSVMPSIWQARGALLSSRAGVFRSWWVLRIMRLSLHSHTPTIRDGGPSRAREGTGGNDNVRGLFRAPDLLRGAAADFHLIS